MENHSAFPDSTTKEKVMFLEGEDVFVTQKDGRLYFGTIVQVEYVSKRCLINFGDDTKQWSFFHTIRRLSSNVVNDGPCCVICKSAEQTDSNEVVICEKCGRGYHQNCHNPKLKNSQKTLHCQRCYHEANLKRDQEPKETVKKIKELKKDKIVLNGGNARKSIVKQDKEPVKEQLQLHRKLPYSPNNLTWDSAHRTNHEQKYCYCGETGQWFFKMIQCLRCKQWFHEKCVKSLTHPLLYGDTFYAFVCENCNDGKEFVRRMELTWIDLVHITMYNLTLVSIKKYHDIDTVISQFIIENWDNFNLPDKIFNTSVPERKAKIYNILQSEKTRFKWGKEVKKKTTLYALRSNVPPSVPPFNIPINGKVSDDTIKQICESNRRVKFIPNSHSATLNCKVNGVQFPREVNYGNLKNSGDAANQTKSNNVSDMAVGKLSVSSEASVESESSSDEVEEESEGGSVKCRPAKGAEFNSDLHRRRASLRVIPEQQKKKIDGRGRKRARSEGGIEEEKEIKNKTARKLIKNAINKSQKLLKTSPTRTDSPKLKASSTANTPIKHIKDERKPSAESLEKLKQRLAQQQQQQTAKKTAAPPLPLAVQTKRQLSEKDIRIGKNGEVKRRRFRRRNTLPGSTNGANSILDLYKSDSTLQSKARTIYHRSAKTASVNPRLNAPLVARSGRDIMQYALNAARLNLQPADDADEDEDEEPEPVPGPSAKPPKDLSPSELRSAIKHYFSPANRIIHGDTFAISGRRTRLDGTIEYLIEWDRPVNL